MFSWLLRNPPTAPGELSPEWVAILRRNVWQYRWLPEPLRERLNKTVCEMVATRRWEGGGGLSVTDEMRLTVAGAAALLTLGHAEPFAFKGLPSIILYASGYTTPDGDRLGEAWHRGPIVLSWADTLRSARRAGRGNNLVLHEFAHHVDGLDGEMDGRPPLEPDADRRWRSVIHWEYDRLVARARRQEVTLLDHYGATNHAEFFAVATECFFERSHDLKAEHGELFELLGQLYGLDPTEWAPQPHRLARRRDATRVATPTYQVDVSDLGLSEADAAFSEGHVLMQHRRFDEAVEAFDRALRASPHDAEALAMRATARLEIDDFPAARADAERALEIEPDNLQAHLAMAECLVELEDYTAAEPHAKRALKLEADSIDAIFFCGLIALHSGRTREATRLLKRASLLDRFDDNTHYWLGSAYERAGDAAKAEHHFRRAEWLAAHPPEENEPEEEPDASD
ncbi:cellulose synthase subunit BcsC [Planctomycetes bacterium MalM25]|nr:cellulose synthase subunit BcsC [Planctomycetes bacterium MalM25]